VRFSLVLVLKKITPQNQGNTASFQILSNSSLIKRLEKNQQKFFRKFRGFESQKDIQINAEHLRDCYDVRNRTEANSSRDRVIKIQFHHTFSEIYCTR
jgi:Neuraminidase (sialidase)